MNEELIEASEPLAIQTSNASPAPDGIEIFAVEMMPICDGIAI